MMAPPAVSVIIPAYNAAEFLPGTLDSVLNQSLKARDVILVDDGSTDGTPKIAESYAGAVTYLRQENRGVAAARNRGLEQVTGDYVCFLDADDYFYPENLRLKVQLLEEDPGVGLVHGWVEVTDANLRPTGTVLKGARGEILSDLLRLIPPAIPCPSNALIRRAVVEEVGGFDEALGTSADFDLWLRIAQRVRVGRVDEVVVKYRRHEGAMFHDLEAQLRDMEFIFRKHRVTLGRHPDWKLLRWRFYRSVAGGYRQQGRLLKGIPPFLKGIRSGGWWTERGEGEA